MIGMWAIMQCLKTTAAGQPSRPYDGACKGPENNERDAVFLGWSRENAHIVHTITCRRTC